MPTIAIAGAGPGLGLSIAKVFGRNGFCVALVSRTQDKLDRLAAELGESGIDTAGFAADIMDRPSLVAAFTRIKESSAPSTCWSTRPPRTTPWPASP